MHCLLTLSVKHGSHEIREFNEEDAEFVSGIKSALCVVTGIGSTLLTDANGCTHLFTEVFYATEAEE